MKHTRGLLLSFLLLLLFIPAHASAGFCEEGRASAYEYYELGAAQVDPRETLELLQACVDESDATTSRLSDRLLLAKFGLKVARDTLSVDIFAQVWEALRPISMLSSVPSKERAAALLLRAQWREYAPPRVYDVILHDALASDVEAICGSAENMASGQCFAARAETAWQQELRVAMQLEPTVAHAAAVQHFMLNFRVNRNLPEEEWAAFETLIQNPKPSTIDLLRLVQNNARAEGVCSRVHQQERLACISLAKTHLDTLRSQSPSPEFEREYVQPTMASWSKAVVQNVGPNDTFVAAGKHLYHQTERALALAISQSSTSARLDLLDLVWTDGATLAAALMLAPVQERQALMDAVKLSSDEQVFQKVEAWLDPALGDSPHVGTVYRDVATRATVKVMRLMKHVDRNTLKSGEAEQLLSELEKTVSELPAPWTDEQRTWLEGPAPVNSIDVALLTFAWAAAAELRLAQSPQETERIRAACEARAAHEFYVGAKKERTAPQSVGAWKIAQLRWLPESNTLLDRLNTKLHLAGCSGASSP